MSASVALLGACILVLSLATPSSGQDRGPALVHAPGPSWPLPPAIDAAAYLLVDGASGQTVAHHRSSERRPVASTVKVLTALTVIRHSDPSETVTVGDEVADATGSGVGLLPGDRWMVSELLDAVISRSGNDAAEALAVHVAGNRDGFLRLMEDEAASLGVTGLRLTTPSGLDDDQHLSAEDLAAITVAALSTPSLRPFFQRRVVDLPGQRPTDTRNLLLESYSGATGVKTGFTTLAGYSLIGSAQREGRELIAVVLGAGPDPQRFEFAAALLDHGFDETERIDILRTISLRLGGRSVEVTAGPASVTIPTGSDLSIDLQPPVHVPVGPFEVAVQVDGEILGSLEAQVVRPMSPPPSSPGAAIGQALVDGAYAALRGAQSAGTLTREPAAQPG